MDFLPALEYVLDEGSTILRTNKQIAQSKSQACIGFFMQKETKASNHDKHVNERHIH